jgi:branched-chain amino acid transport system ATP-binding protein
MNATNLPPLLEVLGLHKSFGGVQAVIDVSFSLQPGQMLALIGPNGAGKSTCFNMINGQLKPDRGEVRIKGQTLAGLAPRQIWMRGVGRTFQVAATFSSMTVAQNVQTVLWSHHRELGRWWRPAEDLRRDEALDLLDAVGLKQQADVAASILAYGDVKRLELAMALGNQPGLLLMDEPTAGMAPGERHALMELTRRLARERQLGVLFTEHSMDVVFAHADHIMVLARGALIAQGSAQEVQDDPKVREVYFGSGKLAR